MAYFLIYSLLPLVVAATCSEGSGNCTSGGKSLLQSSLGHQIGTVGAIHGGQDVEEVTKGVPAEIAKNPAFTAGDVEVATALQAASSNSLLWKHLDVWSQDINDASAVNYVKEGLKFISEKLEQAADAGGTAGPSASHAAYNPKNACPLQDNAARLELAKEIAGAIGILQQLQNGARAWLWDWSRPINPATDHESHRQGPSNLPLTPSWSDISNGLGLFVMLPTFLMTDSGNRTTWFNDRAWTSCWEPSPLFDGPMIFKYKDVMERLTSPEQRRGFYTATAPQSTNFFLKDVLIFLDGQRHSQTRQLLEKAGFARRYPIDSDLVRQIPQVSVGGTLDEKDVYAAVAPSIMKALYGAALSSAALESTLTYSKYGKFTIFGSLIDKAALSHVGISTRIAAARHAVADWVKTTPFYRIMALARDAVAPGNPWFLDMSELSQGLVDGSLFAGVGGTTDMTMKCVKYQQRDEHHRKLFKENPERYLVELMRYDSAVTSVTEVLNESKAHIIEGRKLTFAEGTPVQLVLATANRDPVKWKNPSEFNPSRSDLGDSLAWNGRARDVEARDLKKAPRGCPGFCLSIKVAAAVCAQMLDPMLFEELFKEKKVGGAIECTNFKTPVDAPSVPLWTPSQEELQKPLTYDHSNPGHAPDEVLVKEGADCKSPDHLLGHFSSIAQCTSAVKQAGAKFFVFGHGSAQGWCYAEYTTSKNCPEGWVKSNYNFYDVASIPFDDARHCEVDHVSVDLAEVSGGAATSRSELSRASYSFNTEILAKKSGPSSMWSKNFWGRWKQDWQGQCNEEYRLRCPAQGVQVETWSACCTQHWQWSTGMWGDCTVSGELKLYSSKTLSKHGDQWEVCQDSGQTEWKPFCKDCKPTLHQGDRASPCLQATVTGTSQSLYAVYQKCYSLLQTAVGMFAKFNTWSYHLFAKWSPTNLANHPIAKLLGKSKTSSLLSPTVFDTYTIAMLSAQVHLVLRATAGQSDPAQKRIPMPKQSTQVYLDRLVVYSFLGVPKLEPDADEKSWSQKILNHFADIACVFDSIRQFPFLDGFEDDSNTWPRLTTDTFDSGAHCPSSKTSCTTKEFALGFFQSYTTSGGYPIYPVAGVDFRALYRQSDGSWEDEAERFLAFKYIGQHRLELVGSETFSHGGETAFYMLKTNVLATLEHRKYFGRTGADMYFTEEGLPLAIITPDGDKILRGQVSKATWNYWKFVWRSSAFLLITGVDHLFFSHFSAASLLAGCARETLSVNHPLRRLLTIFTFNTIKTNAGAMHQLVGPGQLMHRSTPFDDFRQVSAVMEKLMPSMKKVFETFFDESLPMVSQNMPLFEDGRLLIGKLKVLVAEWFALYAQDWCSAGGDVVDAEILNFMKRRHSWQMGTHFKDDAAWLGLYSADGKSLKCAGFQMWLTIQMFHVTGFHSHVGTVADLASDPEFATFSWKAGETLGSPRQHMQMMVIAAATSLVKPKLVDDYTFVATGIKSEAEAKGILSRFQADMAQVAQEIKQRNAKRTIPSSIMDPEYVECSIAK